MSRLQPFWAVVRISLVDTQRDAAEFNAWYDDIHVPEFVEQPGIDHAWRTEQVERDHQLGEVDEQYAAIYQLDEIASFQAALDSSPTAGHSWFAWEGRVEKWKRTFFRVLTHFERDDGRGRYWATIRVSYVGDDESEFNRWYDEEHMPEVASNPGFHRAWRLKHEPSESELGDEPRPLLGRLRDRRSAEHGRRIAGQAPVGRAVAGRRRRLDAHLPPRAARAHRALGVAGAVCWSSKARPETNETEERCVTRAWEPFSWPARSWLRPPSPRASLRAPARIPSSSDW